MGHQCQAEIDAQEPVCGSLMVVLRLFGIRKHLKSMYQGYLWSAAFAMAMAWRCGAPLGVEGGRAAMWHETCPDKKRARVRRYDDC